MSAAAATSLSVSKVTASHLARIAYLYVRQSTLRQVVSNTESTQRQYALRQRAVALGWPAEQIVVIDSDQGHSGASVDRPRFRGHGVNETGSTPTPRRQLHLCRIRLAGTGIGLLTRKGSR